MQITNSITLCQYQNKVATKMEQLIWMISQANKWNRMYTVSCTWPMVIASVATLQHQTYSSLSLQPSSYNINWEFHFLPKKHCTNACRFYAYTVEKLDACATKTSPFEISTFLSHLFIHKQLQAVIQNTTVLIKWVSISKASEKGVHTY